MPWHQMVPWNSTSWAPFTVKKKLWWSARGWERFPTRHRLLPCCVIFINLFTAKLQYNRWHLSGLNVNTFLKVAFEFKLFSFILRPGTYPFSAPWGSHSSYFRIVCFSHYSLLVFSPHLLQSQMNVYQCKKKKWGEATTPIYSKPSVLVEPHWSHQLIGL